jgi:cellulose synthase/poly-beta-1,6-N-acetylglucosamine synthase-like glycosyltransferase
MTALHAVFWAFGLTVFVLGLQGAIYFPLTLAYEVWKRRTLGRLAPFTGRVSVVVPAFNEARTIRVSVETVLESSWPDLEVIVVDDGSTDGTAEQVQPLADAGRIRLLRQANAGKARALNAGIAVATGEVVVYTDADSLFLRDTVALLVRWFADPAIDAVCGNDAPLRAGTALQKLLVVTTHIGTGYVRRALSVLRCLPIISGNLGAIRRRVLDEVGGFEPIWGEDLELTWRLQLAGKRIVFDPEPVVLADCPATLGGLWRQRVRWVRSYLKIARRYRGRFLARDAWPFSLYLPLNFANMALVPLLQTGLLLLLPLALSRGWLALHGPWELAAWLGLVFFFAVAAYAILLDREWRDLAYLPWGLLILPVSYVLNAVVIYSWWKEMNRAEEKWEKLGRLESTPGAGRRAWGSWLVLAVMLATVAGALALLQSQRPAPATVVGAGATTLAWAGSGVARPVFSLGLSTHFNPYGDWNDAVRSVLARPLVGLGRVVGVEAGRAEWTYFRWAGQEARWSNHQKGASEDLLATAAAALRARGFQVAAYVDLYAPTWIATHPGSAAILADGTSHPEQVSLAELADGPFGALVVQMVEEIARTQAVDAIDITEAAYRQTSFGPADLASFRTFSGRLDWPRDWRGRPDVEDPTVWAWKSALVERFVQRAAEAAHRHGKQLWMDVAASWKDLKRDGRDHGHDYALLLRHADRLVVWNYHWLEGLPATASTDLARRLAATLPAGRWSMSVGLWGPEGKVITPAQLGQTLAASLEGGARDLWVTPNDQVTDAHWNALLQVWLAPAPR